MIKGRELWDKLQQDICNIILNSKTNLVFLIGENSTGKSEIGEIFKDKITVLDNYRGTFDEIPKDKKVLVITHKVDLLLQAESNTKVIITRTNDLYISTDCDVSNYSDITHSMFEAELISVLLNNSISGNWSELNEVFLQEYLETHKLNDADKCVLDTMERFKNSLT